MVWAAHRSCLVSHLSPQRWSPRIAEHDHVLVLALLAKGVRLHDARDLAQEAWARLIEADRDGKLERIDLPGLVIRQAMFLLAEQQRVRSRRLLEDAGEAARLEAPGGQPESILEARQRLSVVASALSTVTPRGREVMETWLGSTTGHAEQAARVGLSVQRFRQVLCEVRARLRAALGETSR